jgi:hypothetical protein
MSCLHSLLNGLFTYTGLFVWALILGGLSLYFYSKLTKESE